MIRKNLSFIIAAATVLTIGYAGEPIYRATADAGNKTIAHMRAVGETQKHVGRAKAYTDRMATLEREVR